MFFFCNSDKFLCTYSTTSNFAVLEIGNWRNFQFWRSFQINPIANVISILYNRCFVIPICLSMLNIYKSFLYIFLNCSLIYEQIRFEPIISIVALIQLSTTLQMFTGNYRDFTGKSECRDFKFMGIACIPAIPVTFKTHSLISIVIFKGNLILQGYYRDSLH